MFRFQILPRHVALVVGDWSAKDGSSDAFASEVSAAVSAASAAAASAGLDAPASNNYVSLTVLHHVLSGCPVSSRHAAVTHLPCLITQFTPSQNVSEDDAVVHRIVSAAALGVLSVSCSTPSSPLAHPLSTANHIISSAASRIGNTSSHTKRLLHLESHLSQAWMLPSLTSYQHWHVLMSRAPRFTSLRGSTRPAFSLRPRCVS
jgi:hypothetical protein